MRHNALDEAIERLADGEPIDWAAMERRAITPADREVLQQLRILAGLEDVHKSTPLVPSGAELPTTTDDAHARVVSVPAQGGQRWGRYRLVRLIGKGGYGAVYLARDDELDRDVAIKLLHQSLAARGDLAQRVKAEGRALARVRHPNVVTVYGVEEHEGQLGLCMEYIHGRTLDDIVRADGPLNANEAMVVGQDVCRGLAAVHAAGVIHRDVKARNVIRERAGRIVLMDLGAGALTGPEDETGPPDTVGTPVYMAPEILGGGFPTPRSDVYAVGILLYFLATGTYPVVAATIDEIRSLHRRRSRVAVDERRHDLPEAFVRVVERATAHDVAERPESAVALLRELSGSLESTQGSAAIRSGTPITSSGPWPQAQSREWLRRARLGVAIGSGVFGLAVLSGLLTTWSFNWTIARPSTFASDSLIGTVMDGLSSMVLPLAVMGVLLGAGSVVQLLLKPFPWARQLWRRIAERLLPPPGSPSDEAVTNLAEAAVLGGFIAFGLAYAAYSDVFYVYVKSISEHDLEYFAPLRPENQVHRVYYRVTFAAVLLVVLLGWRAVRNIRIRRGARVPAWVRGAGVVLIVILFLFLQAPYRAMQRNAMDVVLYEGARCYKLGQQGDAVRLYCPTWSPPRVRTMTTSHPTYHACGFEENVFLVSSATDCTRR